MDINKYIVPNDKDREAIFHSSGYAREAYGSNIGSYSDNKGSRKSDQIVRDFTPTNDNKIDCFKKDIFGQRRLDIQKRNTGKK
jgi:hypothetical protein